MDQQNRTLEVEHDANADRSLYAIQPFADGNVRAHRPIDPHQVILVGLVQQVVRRGLQYATTQMDSRQTQY